MTSPDHDGEPETPRPADQAPSADTDAGAQAPVGGAAPTSDAEPAVAPPIERAGGEPAVDFHGVVLHGDPPAPVAPGDAPDTAARKVMWLHVGRLLDRELEVRDPNLPDSLRKYRVATRRLRSALRIFAFALPAGTVNRLRTDLGELADAVGAVRDLDVRIAGATARGEASEAGKAPLEPLIAAWRAERAHAYARLLARLETKRHRRFLERLVELVDEPAGLPSMAGGRPAASVRAKAAGHVWEAYERVRAYGEIIRWADLAALHRLRTETKRCRYTLEFLADILGPERPWLVQRLTALQDHLGAINDAAVTAAAIRSFLEVRSGLLEPAARAATAEYLAEREREVTRLRRGIGRAWRPIVAVTFVRRLGRTVVIA